MTSCADHSRGAGRHCIAAGGTFASDAFSNAGPAAYRSINVSRSARVNDIDVPRPKFDSKVPASIPRARTTRDLDPPRRPYETPPVNDDPSTSSSKGRNDGDHATEARTPDERSG